MHCNTAGYRHRAAAGEPDAGAGRHAGLERGIGLSALFSSNSGTGQVLNTGMTIVSCLYIAVGFFGYLRYGEAVTGSITLSLPSDQLSVISALILSSADPTTALSA